MSDSIKVAVRVRPFNSREKKLGCKCVVNMKGPNTEITNPETGRVRPYTFDYSYWSFDKENGELATQDTLFNDMGNEILDLAFKGYNCCLLAYGQTGAGKSYSMVGVPGNNELRGIIPRVCEALFQKIEQSEQIDVKYTMKCSMIEIYNEEVRDLFNPSSKRRGGLKVREHPKKGPYVEGLFKAKVTSYEQVQKLMDEGSKVRTIASTKMNATSSRAHTVFMFYFTQTTEFQGKKSEKVSQINLVDLAGSERADKTGASGQRLKEGSAINQSLSSLGNCINALSKGGKRFVPYRSSTLTWLLKESLGGNSKTYLIAAISPADNNFDETKSTLNYAKRAKKITLKAIVNEDPSAKIIRALKKEIEELKNKLGDGGEEGKEDDEDDKMNQKLREELKSAQSLIDEMMKTDEEQEEEMKRIEQEREKMIKESGVMVSLEGFSRSEDPHLINLREDPMLSEQLIYPLDPNHTKKTEFKIGSEKGSDVLLEGIGMLPHHATVLVEDPESEKKLYLIPQPGAECHVNGKRVTEKQLLNHGDRLILASNKVFKFIHPKYAAEVEDSNVLGFGDALNEMAKQMAQEMFEKQMELFKQQQEQKEEEGEVTKPKKKSLFGESVLKVMQEQKEKTEEEQEQTNEEEQQQTNEEQQQQPSSTTPNLSNELISLVPLVNEGDKIAEALGRGIDFEISVNENKELVVEVNDLKNKMKSYWSVETFKERLIGMREVYSKKQERKERRQMRLQQQQEGDVELKKEGSSLRRRRHHYKRNDGKYQDDSSDSDSDSSSSSSSDSDSDSDEEKKTRRSRKKVKGRWLKRRLRDPFFDFRGKKTDESEEGKEEEKNLKQKMKMAEMEMKYKGHIKMLKKKLESKDKQNKHLVEKLKKHKKKEKELSEKIAKLKKSEDKMEDKIEEMKEEKKEMENKDHKDDKELEEERKKAKKQKKELETEIKELKKKLNNFESAAGSGEQKPKEQAAGNSNSKVCVIQ